jgi:hypothetical protein
MSIVWTECVTRGIEPVLWDVKAGFMETCVTTLVYCVLLVATGTMAIVKELVQKENTEISVNYRAIQAVKMDAINILVPVIAVVLSVNLERIVIKPVVKDVFLIVIKMTGDVHVK